MRLEGGGQSGTGGIGESGRILPLEDLGGFRSEFRFFSISSDSY